jgi:hypothetical protein
MPSETAQVFMSYAWKDNQIPPRDPLAEKGFATDLAEQIKYDFGQGEEKTELWWDKDKIDEIQLFNPMIEDAIEASSLFLIVLSGHWIASEYCQKELELFRRRWRHLDDYRFQHRIVLAHKTFVPEHRRPKILPIQRGFHFFTQSPDGSESPFHWRGRGTPEFFKTAGTLGQVLIKHARLKDPGVLPPPPPAPKQRPEDPDAHKVYLAKPAADMRASYVRLHHELSAQGYNVVPPLESEIPYDASAEKFIDEALRDAVLSVHVIGKSAGFNPEKLAPIVELQLNQAEAKAAKDDGEAKSDDPGKKGWLFHRVAWVPGVFEDEDGKLIERNPVETFKSYGRHRSGDRIEGDSLSPFIVFLLQHLRSVPPKPRKLPELKPGDKVYLCHDEVDTLYAAKVGALLAQRNQSYDSPVYFGTSESKRDAHHKKQLSECSAVVMCWAGGSELWARGQSRELANWEALGRIKQFSMRGLIAGPPPHVSKDDKVLRFLFPEREIDVIENVTGTEDPTPDSIARMFTFGTNPGP